MTSLAEVLAAVDAANAGDPVRVVVDGVERPREVVRAELVSTWVHRLRPEASDELAIAARAHHVQRWRWPRGDHPPGRAGYLKWRRDVQRCHIEVVSEIMQQRGWSPAAIARVGTIMGKRDLATDPEVRTYEDALALTFLETQFDDLAARTDRDRMVDIVAKTLGKMSPAGQAAAAGIELDAEARDLLLAAVTRHRRRTQRP